MRTDFGSENSIITFIQPTLRHAHTDDLSGISSHRYGKSITNQVHNYNSMALNTSITAIFSMAHIERSQWKKPEYMQHLFVDILSSDVLLSELDCILSCKNYYRELKHYGHSYVNNALNGG